MEEMTQRGQEARNLLIHFGKHVAKELPEVEYDSCSNWVNQGQIVPIYFWLELKSRNVRIIPTAFHGVGAGILSITVNG